MDNTATVNERALLPPSRAHSFLERVRAGETIAYLITLGAAVGIFVITALVWYELFSQSELTRHKFGWSFLTISVWNPVTNQFGALPFIYGTVITATIALMIAI